MSAYRPAWWLPDPHSMTIWGKFFRKRVLPEVRVMRVPTPDGDELTVMMAGPATGSPIVVILHGLEGGPQSHYVGGIMAAALERGWQARLLLFRTCDGRIGPVRRTYHSGETTDLDLIVRRLVAEAPGTPIGMVGVSLGGNVLLKWLGESGDATPPEVQAAVAVSVPFDLARCSRAINTGVSRLYQWNFLRSLKRKAHAKRAQHPDVVDSVTIDRVRTMWEFDDEFTAPLHGFRDASDYYARSSSIRFLDGIRRPTLLVSAADDPFLAPDVLRDAEAVCATNPCLVPEFHLHGGHVGFVSGTPWDPEYYLDSRVGGFLAEHLSARDTRDDRRTGRAT